jgi:hypothetical protein
VFTVRYWLYIYNYAPPQHAHSSTPYTRYTPSSSHVRNIQLPHYIPVNHIPVNHILITYQSITYRSITYQSITYRSITYQSHTGQSHINHIPINHIPVNHIPVNPCTRMLLQWKSNKHYTRSECAFVALVIQQAKRMRNIACPAAQYFPTLSHKGHD